jgi:hypothetical protein
MFHMDAVVKNLVERECEKLAPRCPHLVRLELECFALGQLEAGGKAMRYLRRNGKAIAWKVTPKMHKELAGRQPDCTSETLKPFLSVCEAQRPPAEWARSVAYPKESLAADLARLGDTWRSVQTSRDRDAIFAYLTEVFELVRWWAFEGQAKERAARALAFKEVPIPKNIESYRAVVAASLAPETMDKRTVSKWSRALRFAAACKSDKIRLQKFIKRQGGINACTAKYAQSMKQRR